MAAEIQSIRRACLCILDGWGWRKGGADNAIFQTPTPNWDGLLHQNQMTLLNASGPAVGLPEGQMGNSEVGHMTIGAGRIIMQGLSRINAAFAEGLIGEGADFADFTARLHASGGSAHLFGLLSSGGVHGHVDHAIMLARALIAKGITVWVHAFTDGRDTAPGKMQGDLQHFIAEVPDAQIATVSGRYWAMDRDQNWARCQPVLDAIASAKGLPYADPVSALEARLQAGETDEFVRPCVIGSYPGFEGGDGLICFNFRADRVRQITAMMGDTDHPHYDPHFADASASLAMVEYSPRLGQIFKPLFGPPAMASNLGSVIAERGFKQFRIAETEKYAHVTFFLNGGREQPYPGETRHLVPSPKVATYDLCPEMAADEVCTRLVTAIEAQEYGLSIVNFANPDMVGHTGNFTAACKAVAVIDAALGRLIEACKASQTVLLVTADHGNIEQMSDHQPGHASLCPNTTHSLNPVPMIVYDPAGLVSRTKASGGLCDIAPTVLSLMGLDAPESMTGTPLFARADSAADS